MKINKIITLLLALVVSLGLQAQNKPENTTLTSKNSALPIVTIGGAEKINYVRTYDLYAPMQTFPTGGAITTQVNAGNIMQTTQYVDGLGRPIQSVVRQGSGDFKDMVSFITYDAYGRQVFQPMSYEANTTDGRLQLTPSQAQQIFLNGHYSEEDIFYGKTEYEASPLNRVLKQMAPGNSWAGNNKGISTQYGTNDSGEGVRKWTIGTGPVSTSVYGTGELMVITTTDENGQKVKEYTNSRGLVILKKVQEAASPGTGHTGWLCTYYVYDDYNNLRYVLPPRAVQLTSNDWVLDNTERENLTFAYTYDDLHRMITKKVPGAGRVDMVYDKLDRLVLTQDSVQRGIDQWSFTKYDAMNRPALTGFIIKAMDRSDLQSIADAWPGVMNVRRDGLNADSTVVEGASITTSNRDTGISTYRHKDTGFVDFLPGFESETNADFVTQNEPLLSFEYTYYEGYYDGTFPWLSVNEFEVNTVNYYDDYEFTPQHLGWSTNYNGFYDSLANPEFNPVTPQQYNDVKGLATGSKVRILGTDEFLTTVMYYDDRGRVIQTQGENHLGGTDITTTQYDFSGRVLHTYTKHENPNATAHSTTRILKQFAYDKHGRLLTIKEKLNDTGSFKTLVTNSYNALGELESKSLGDPTSPLETLDYDYNVRGWLRSINGDELETADHGTDMTNHYFAMELFYDQGFEQKQYNGNIAGVKWKSKSSDQIRAYGFDYDKVNRLTAADYSQGSTWTQSINDFSTSYSYDANGNILDLMRKGTIAGTITTIDDLSYNYGSGFGNASNGNQLKAVQDIEGDLGQGDFKDGDSSGDDYQYDGNGNMKDDLNKGITNITYNHLNLPVTVSFGSSKSITYTYDAAGIKLSKAVNDNGTITTTDYAGGFIYENDALQHFAHEEGRVRVNNNNSLVYDYFIKDHLGNTRMTLTEETEVITYRATMEVGTNTAGEQVDQFEESVFLYMDAVRDNTNPGANTTNVPGINDEYTARLNGSEADREVGPAKMIVVNAGDQLDVSVDYYHTGSYTDNGTISKANMITAIAGLFGGASTGSLQETAIYNQFNDPAASAIAYVGTRGNAANPRAYLNVVVFDKDFNMVSGSSAFQQTAATSGFGALSHSLTLSEGGYVYVYLSNESQTDFDVHFDNLEIEHTKGHILQEDHYYPGGATISALSSSAPLSTPNKYRFNGKELQDDFDLNWYDYEARFYDPQILRFTTIDPLADHRKQVNMSPYAAFWNNPIKYVDPDGRFVIDPNATRKQKRAIRQAIRKVRKFVRNKDVQAAMQKFGQLDLKQLKADLKNGQGPLIKVAPLKGAYGEFTPNTGSNELRVQDKLLKKQDEATGDKKKDYKFLTAVTILHENTHRGDDQNGIDYPGEEGSQMEQASFGVVVDETNMRSARENYPGRAKQARKDARAQAKKERVQRRKKRKTNTP